MKTMMMNYGERKVNTLSSKKLKAIAKEKAMLEREAVRNHRKEVRMKNRISKKAMIISKLYTVIMYLVGMFLYDKAYFFGTPIFFGLSVYTLWNGVYSLLEPPKDLDQLTAWWLMTAIFLCSTAYCLYDKEKEETEISLFKRAIWFINQKRMQAVKRTLEKGDVTA